MDFMDLANLAWRNKDYATAHMLFEKILEKDGGSPEVFMSISKIYYLEKRYNEALMFSLAGAHLSIYEYYKKYKENDPVVMHAYKVIPADIRRHFTHPIGALLLHEPDILKHTAHAFSDQETIFSHNPDLRRYANVYNAYLLDDGSYKAALAENNLTEAELVEHEVDYYIAMGTSIVNDQLKWFRINDSNVSELYLDT